MPPIKWELKASQLSYVIALIALTSAFGVFISTDRFFEVIDDETTVISATRLAFSTLVQPAANGKYRHEHPPLADALLKIWRPIAGNELWALRLPSVALYLTGIMLLALSAEKLGGARSFMAAIGIGTLWPFAFHFARLVGWYSLCFFLVSLLTLNYLFLIERPDNRRLAIFILVALLLVYTNYYGWIILACLAFDLAVIRRHPRSQTLVLATFLVLVIAYLPIWSAIAIQVGSKAHFLDGGTSIASRTINAVFCLYSLFVSEAVAPWGFPQSIAAVLGIIFTLTCSAVVLPAIPRRFLVYFGVLFLGMFALDIGNTKRLLGISPWLILPLAIAISTSSARKILRNTLAVGMATLALVGWTGTISRDHYSSLRFIEPWSDLAAVEALSVAKGDIVISNSPAFLYQMNESLRNIGLIPKDAPPGLVDHPSVIDTRAWSTNHKTMSANLVFVHGVNPSTDRFTNRFVSWLQRQCSTIKETKLLPDAGYNLKEYFFEGHGQTAFRITISHHRCRDVDVDE